MKRVLASGSAWMLGLCMTLAAPATAQHERGGGAPDRDESTGVESTRDNETARSLALLRERNRETMHPGEHLTIVGLEQGDNEIRSATPALAHCDPTVALVDPQDAYGRALAMYEKGSIFHQPPARSTSTALSPTEKARSPAAKQVEAGLGVPEKVSSALFLAVGLLFLLGVRRHLRVFLRRRRPAT